MKIRHIFFDLDNTLWDHRRNAYLTLKDLFEKEKVTDKYALEFEEFHNEYFTINENLWAQIRDGKIDKEYLRKHRFYDSFLFFGIDDFDLAQRFEFQFLDQIVKYNELVAGAKEILDYLYQKDYQLHILSNGFQEVTHRKIEMSGIKEYFTTVTSADELHIRKPNPEIYTYALQKANAHTEESAMIGDDWIADVEGAKALGLKTVFFDVFKDGFSADGIHVIDELHDLKSIF